RPSCKARGDPPAATALRRCPSATNGTLEAGLRFAIAADPTTCHRAPCRLDKHERITRLALRDSFARPPAFAFVRWAARMQHTILHFHSPVSPGYMIGRSA